MNDEVIIIAIDGPSGVGKSTVADAVARRLNLPNLETGAMYRALGWEIYRRRIDPLDQTRVEAVAERLDLELEEGEDGEVVVLVDGRPLAAEVRLPEVSEITSQISSYPAVRRRMVELQRRFGRKRGAVMEGRDIGTVVFPDTPYKFFLTAPQEVRVQRRVAQLERAGKSDLTVAAIEAEVASRDQRDSRREESPLKMDSSYSVIDTAELSARQSAELIVETVGRLRRSRGGDC